MLGDFADRFKNNVTCCCLSSNDLAKSMLILSTVFLILDDFAYNDTVNNQRIEKDDNHNNVYLIKFKAYLNR